MSAWAWARKPDRSSAGRKGSTGVDDGEERQMQRGVAGEEGYCSGVGFGVGEGEEAGSLVGGEEGEHRRRRPRREADATGKKGKGEQAVGGGEERHAVAGEEGEAAASESVTARVRKPDRSSAGSTGVGGGEERQTRGGKGRKGGK